MEAAAKFSPPVATHDYWGTEPTRDVSVKPFCNGTGMTIPDNAGFNPSAEDTHANNDVYNSAAGAHMTNNVNCPGVKCAQCFPRWKNEWWGLKPLLSFLYFWPFSTPLYTIYPHTAPVVACLQIMP